MSNLSSKDHTNALAPERLPLPTPNAAAFIISLTAFLSITACIGNVFILVALRKVTSISSPTKLLFFSLAVSDLISGLISEPLFIMDVIPALVFVDSNLLYYSHKAGVGLGYVLNTISILTSTAISVDRLLALVLGLAYRSVVTVRRVRPIVFCFWLMSCILGGWRCTTQSAARIGFIAVLVLCLVTSVTCYIRIYSLLRRHERQVHGSFQQAQQPNRHVAPLDMARYKKTVSSIAWIQFTFLVCFIPYIVMGMLFTLREKMYSDIAEVVLFNVSISMLYLNSSLNPILYVWKIREVEQILKAELRALRCC